MGVPAAVRNTAIGFVVLLFVAVAGGVAYTYFLGPDGSQPTKAASTEPAMRAPSKPRQPSPDTKVSASVQSLMTPIQAGANTSITVKTVATAKCTIVVAYNNVASTDSGLSPKIADEYGVVSWTWTVPKDAPVGTWPATTTCVFNERSAVVRGDLEVTK